VIFTGVVECEVKTLENAIRGRNREMQMQNLETEEVMAEEETEAEEAGVELTVGGVTVAEVVFESPVRSGFLALRPKTGPGLVLLNLDSLNNRTVTDEDWTTDKTGVQTGLY
jgi:hypothetical protein